MEVDRMMSFASKDDPHTETPRTTWRVAVDVSGMIEERYGCDRRAAARRIDEAKLIWRTKAPTTESVADSDC